MYGKDVHTITYQCLTTRMHLVISVCKCVCVSISTGVFMNVCVCK